jgi:hypothetical protein
MCTPTIGKHLLRCRVIVPPQELVSYAFVLPFSRGANDNAGAAIIHQLTVACALVTASRLFNYAGPDRTHRPHSRGRRGQCASTLQNSVYTIFEDYPIQRRSVRFASPKKISNLRLHSEERPFDYERAHMTRNRTNASRSFLIWLTGRVTQGEHIGNLPRAALWQFPLLIREICRPPGHHLPPFLNFIDEA